MTRLADTTAIASAYFAAASWGNIACLPQLDAADTDEWAGYLKSDFIGCVSKHRLSE